MYLLLCYTEWNEAYFRVHQMAWGKFDHLRKKAQKGVTNLERKYYTNNLYIIDGANLYQFHHFKYFLGNSS